LQKAGARIVGKFGQRVNVLPIYLWIGVATR
jgi:hypothetical protein